MTKIFEFLIFSFLFLKPYQRPLARVFDAGFMMQQRNAVRILRLTQGVLRGLNRSKRNSVGIKYRSIIIDVLVFECVFTEEPKLPG